MRVLIPSLEDYSLLKIIFKNYKKLRVSIEFLEFNLKSLIKIEHGYFTIRNFFESTKSIDIHQLLVSIEMNTQPNCDKTSV